MEAVRTVCRVAGLLAMGWPMASQAADTRLPDWAAAPASLLPMRLPVADTPGWQLRASAADFEAVDATAVRGLSGDWDQYSPRRGRNVALQSAQVDLTASRRGWEIATLVRGEALISGPRSSWDAVHLYKQKTDPLDGSRVAVDVRYDTAILAGARVAKTWSFQPEAAGPLQLTTAASLLSVRRVQHIALGGTVDYSAVAGYGFSARGERQDSGKQFGGYGDEGALGRGYSLDLGLLWQPTSRTFVNVSATDLVSRLSVDGVSTQQATFSSTTRSYDDNGYLSYQPLVSGRYTAETVRTRLPRKSAIAAGTRLSDADDAVLVGVRWERFGTVDLPAAWAVLPAPAGLRLRFDHDLRFKSIGVGLVSPYFSVSCRLRSLPVGQSGALGWEGSLNLPL